MDQTAIAILIVVGAGLVVLARNLDDIPDAKLWRLQRKSAAIGSKEPKSAESPLLDFPYCPGKPEGYAGYTDYNAMLQTINDDLVDRDTEWQFRTIGFAKGFLSELLIRTGSAEDATSTFRAVDASRDDAMTIGWMAFMQTAGADNASPSTSNMTSAVLRVAADLPLTGPYRNKFWSKARDGLKEDPAEAGISSERLLALAALLQDAERRGQLLAAKSQIVPLDFAGAE
ncbi:MAG: hypothetical protein ABW023_13760 [Sphingomonas sp.]